MSVAYVDLVDYVAIAAEGTGLEVGTLMRVAKLDLADSALHAPAAGFGDVEFYPDFVDKAAVLVVHLAARPSQDHRGIDMPAGASSADSG